VGGAPRPEAQPVAGFASFSHIHSNDTDNPKNKIRSNCSKPDRLALHLGSRRKRLRGGRPIKKKSRRTWGRCSEDFCDWPPRIFFNWFSARFQVCGFCDPVPAHPRAAANQSPTAIKLSFPDLALRRREGPFETPSRHLLHTHAGPRQSGAKLDVRPSTRHPSGGLPVGAARDSSCARMFVPNDPRADPQMSNTRNHRPGDRQAAFGAGSRSPLPLGLALKQKNKKKTSFPAACHSLG